MRKRRVDPIDLGRALPYSCSAAIMKPQPPPRPLKVAMRWSRPCRSFSQPQPRWHTGSIGEEKAARRDVVNMVTAASGLVGHRHSQRWRRQQQTAAEAAPARCNSAVTFGKSKAAPAPCASQSLLSAGSTRLVESLPRKGREHRKSGPEAGSKFTLVYVFSRFLLRHRVRNEVGPLSYDLTH